MPELPSTFLDRVDAIIEANLSDEDFTIVALARQLNLSCPQTYRKIHHATNVSPSVYVRNKRLEYACYLLEVSELNIAEITYRVGFNTQAYFSKCFSDYYGSPPSRYRKGFSSPYLPNKEIQDNKRFFDLVGDAR